ncbi:hypothetical protein DPX16_13892 [Anabarilius grahami]|uniref:Uncharacterized protein n=1 Tax=Anabarilius grahami TaxID=495550 RepID=A0A3N0XVA6_ANAGA|nr:hypothetical protein DPX16_13892 [Anabarilius grahami]
MASGLGPTFILEKLSSAGESYVGRPENRRGGCFDSFSSLMMTGNTDVASMMAEYSGEAPVKAGDSGVVSVTAGDSDVAAMVAGGSGMAATMGRGSGV